LGEARIDKGRGAFEEVCITPGSVIWFHFMLHANRNMQPLNNRFVDEAFRERQGVVSSAGEGRNETVWEMPVPILSFFSLMFLMFKIVKGFFGIFLIALLIVSYAHGEKISPEVITGLKRDDVVSLLPKAWVPEVALDAVYAAAVRKAMNSTVQITLESFPESLKKRWEQLCPIPQIECQVVGTMVMCPCKEETIFMGAHQIAKAVAVDARETDLAALGILDFFQLAHGGRYLREVGHAADTEVNEFVQVLNSSNNTEAKEHRRLNAFTTQFEIEIPFTSVTIRLYSSKDSWKIDCGASWNNRAAVVSQTVKRGMCIYFSRNHVRPAADIQLQTDYYAGLKFWVQPTKLKIKNSWVTGCMLKVVGGSTTKVRFEKGLYCSGEGLADTVDYFNNGYDICCGGAAAHIGWNCYLYNCGDL